MLGVVSVIDELELVAELLEAANAGTAAREQSIIASNDIPVNLLAN